MNEFKGTFLKKIDRTHNVSSFRFKPDEEINFIPGQFAQLIFNEADRADKNLNKYLSFSNAPNDEYIEFTKKLSASDFSNRLRNLKSGDKLLFKGPLGNCVFKNEYSKIGFIIGGIGITPVISILEYVVKNQLDSDICLLYSNWSEADIAFNKDLVNWSSQNKNIRVVDILMENKSNNPKYPVGMITKDFISSQMKDYNERVLFLFGPPVMVNAMKNICLELNCKQENLKIENFIGY